MKYMNRMYWWFRDLRWQIPNSLDRMKRGWGDADTWQLDDYLARVIEGSVSHLKKLNHGYPAHLTETEWDNILDNIIYTFNTAKLIANDEVLYIETDTEDWFMKYNKAVDEWYERHSILYMPLTRDECERYEKGWELFQKYFFSLWD